MSTDSPALCTFISYSGRVCGDKKAPSAALRGKISKGVQQAILTYLAILILFHVAETEFEGC